MGVGEADEFHPQANIDKMQSGIALTDDDRWPWLRELAAWMGERHAAGVSTVLACSALKRSYRDVLRGGVDGVEFVHLAGPAETIAARLARREDHFMPPSLLESQFATLEPLASDEAGIDLDLAASPVALVAQAAAYLRG